MRRRLIFFAPLAIAGVALFVFIGGEIVKLLWNWLAPALFGLPHVTFWQALGLLVLCRILFGGMGRHGGAPRMSNRMRSEDHEHFRQRLRERFGFMRGTQKAGGLPSEAREAGDGEPAAPKPAERAEAGNEM